MEETTSTAGTSSIQSLSPETARRFLDEKADETGAAILVLPKRYDLCLIGWCDDIEYQTPRAVYSTAKIIRVLMDLDGMAYDEASEFFSFNIEGAFMSPAPPIYVDEVIS